MKRLFTMLLSGLVFFACQTEGPQGLDGFDGADGVDGVNGEEAYVFEYELNFTSPEYSALLELPTNFTMLDSDVMLVYLLWETTDNGTEVWRPVPQTLFFSDGILNYNFDFTKYDATVFLDGTVNLDILDVNLTDNWIAKIVVVPGQFTNGRSIVDLSDYDEVKEYYNLPLTELSTEHYVSRPE